MKKIYISIFACVCALTGFAQTTTTDPGVVINGVTWATRNVDAPGTFAATPESFGKFYQWNRKIAWATEGTVTNWNTSTPTGIEWETANCPCPDGWRVPTKEEMESLLATRGGVTTQNGIYGLFRGTAPNTVFLPYAAQRNENGNLTGFSAGRQRYGYYWTSTVVATNNSVYAYDSNSIFRISGTSRTNGLPVRCVSTQTSAVENVKSDELQIIIENGELKIENYESGNIQIYDISGRNVESLNTTSLSNGTQTINISHLPAGVYIVKAGNHTKKIVKQ